MTIKVIMTCDSSCCTEEVELVSQDETAEDVGWYTDNATGLHYCPECWDEWESN